MKLDYECIRDLLLVIEATTTYNDCFTLSNDEKLKNYSLDNLQYHLRQCNLAGFLYQYIEYMDGDISVTDLSFQGHDFLNAIRTDKIWSSTKNICKELGVKTLNGLIQISSQVIAQVISKHLGM